jgi:hypothetical protein
MKRALVALLVLILPAGNAMDLSSIEKDINQAVDELVRKEGDGWFMIIEDPRTRKFVQFVWGTTEGLSFDLPSQALDQVELQRAKKVLSVYDIALETWQVYDRPNGNVVGEQCGFNKDISDTPELAKKIALDVFLEIYQVDPKTNLGVTIEK